VDDILCVHHDPGAPLAKLDEYFKMKEGSIQVPTSYLGAKLKKTVLPNGVVAWGMSSSKYVQSAVQNVQDYLATLPGDHKLLKKASGPFAGGYKPELDESPELDPTRANFYQSKIGILRWCVELGRIDIITEVSMLSTSLCLQREGHLESVLHVFEYLGLHNNARVVFDPTYPAVDMGTVDSITVLPPIVKAPPLHLFCTPDSYAYFLLLHEYYICTDQSMIDRSIVTY
jgi:hypothetical protein